MTLSPFSGLNADNIYFSSSYFFFYLIQFFYVIFILSSSADYFKRPPPVLFVLTFKSNKFSLLFWWKAFFFDTKRNRWKTPPIIQHYKKIYHLPLYDDDITILFFSEIFRLFEIRYDARHIVDLKGNSVI